jgi:hypothetical protein
VEAFTGGVLHRDVYSAGAGMMLVRFPVRLLA